jgi:hypothetical protein
VATSLEQLQQARSAAIAAGNDAAAAFFAQKIEEATKIDPKAAMRTTPGDKSAGGKTIIGQTNPAQETALRDRLQKQFEGGLAAAQAKGDAKAVEYFTGLLAQVQLGRDKTAFEQQGVGAQMAQGAGRAIQRTGEGLGNLVGLVSDEEMKKGRRTDAIQADSGGAGLGGAAADLAVSALPIVGGSKLVTGGVKAGAKYLPGAGRKAAEVLAPWIGDAASMAGYSAATDVTGDRAGAARNAALAATTGRAVGTVAGKIVSPGMQATPEAAAMLREGVPLTPGLALRPGSPLRVAEERAKALPWAGPVVRDAGETALRGWNRIDIKKVMGKDFGEGSKAVNAAISEIQAGYNKLLAGRRFTPDQAFEAQLQAIEAKFIKNPQSVLNPESQANLQATLNQIRAEFKPVPGSPPVYDHMGNIITPATPGSPGSLAGESWKEAVETPLRDAGTKAARRGDMAETKALEEVRGAVKGLRDRQIPPNILPATAELDAQYAGMLRREYAMRPTGSQQANAYHPNALLGAARTMDKSPNKRGFMRGTTPGKADADTANVVFGDTIPRIGPGTAEKMMMGTSILSGGKAAYELATGDPSSAARWGVGVVAPWAAAKAYTSPMMLRYLTSDLPKQQQMATVLRGVTPLLAREAVANPDPEEDPRAALLRRMMMEQGSR